MTLHDDEARLINPCTKFLRFSGKKVSYYDKEKKQNIEVKTPVTFVALIELSAISGFDEANNCGIYSNEVEKLSEQLMKVRSFKGGDLVCGLYGDIKDKAKVAGGRFTKSVYGLMDGELVNFQLRGASLKGWIDKAPGTKFQIKEFEEGKKGSVTYFVPVFTPQKFEDEKEKKAARETLDSLMNDYLQPYWTQKQEELAIFHSNGFNTDVSVGSGVSDAEQRKADRAVAKDIRAGAKKLAKEREGLEGDALREAILKDSPSEDDLPF